jgi:tetratricopeptide (TPR) repeat protein
VANESVTIESGARLSESILWQLQKKAYMQFGMTAWIDKGVPSYITGHPFTTQRYVSVTIGYLQDCLKNRAKTAIDLNEPIYFFDLGAGSGRFAYAYLKQLFADLEILGLQDLKICYVMTDIVLGNIEFCRNHPLMQKWIEAGNVEFALFEHSQTTPLKLIISNKELTILKNPAIVIANYFFDTIPQDLFRIENDELQEGRITLSVPSEAVKGRLDDLDPTWIPKLTLNQHYVPCSSQYYDNQGYNAILEEYRNAFNGATFLFPYGSFQVIDYFAKLSGDRFLLLAGDQGYCTPEQIQGWGVPEIAQHGSFSMSVSYHALAQYFKHLNGAAFLTQLPDPRFVVIAALLGGNASFFPLTHYAFKNTIDAFEPYDFWKISEAVVTSEAKDISLDWLLAILKLGYWDPTTFHHLYASIRQQLPKGKSSQKELLVKSIDKVWDQFYPVGNAEGDFIMNLGVLLFEMKRFDAAKLYFQRAFELSGSNPLLDRNIAACDAIIKLLAEDKNKEIDLKDIL